MTIRHFNTLCQHKHLKNVLLDGVFIADRHEEERMALLFQINSYYVEVIFNTEGNEVLDSRSFENVDELDPYLQCVSLSGVL